MPDKNPNCTCAGFYICGPCDPKTTALPAPAQSSGDGLAKLRAKLVQSREVSRRRASSRHLRGDAPGALYSSAQADLLGDIIGEIGRDLAAEETREGERVEAARKALGLLADEAMARCLLIEPRQDGRVSLYEWRRARLIRVHGPLSVEDALRALAPAPESGTEQA